MRRVFFSFHYVRDVTRAQQVKNSWVTKPDRESAGFFDSSVFESKKRSGDEILRRFLADALVGSSVTSALIGTETWSRRWVRFELVKSFEQGKGILSISINRLKGFNKGPDPPGPDALEFLGYAIQGNRLNFQEFTEGAWRQFSDLPSMPLSDVCYDLPGATGKFSQIFSRYDWITDDGYTNLGRWVEGAAQLAGR